ncbi:hypothetical protein FHS82_001246 [Pseudochelatococcus lubricantis]|uniref:Uncharacterized protein n=1 Tax=Pseudochelatococcus lubricantis TaxID=1538102 RepID=A0ABX0UZV8_9HYPH|nr:hypothetical protein [Pseudochelatococcus lubricantis]NIJ57420.1 hypothetical protein [Pseudochelatococcus lubricantis]
MFLLFVIILSLVGAVALSWVLGRQGVYVAGVALLIGSGIALLGPIITSCRLCWTEVLSIAAFLSSPFFIVGWIALAQANVFHVPQKLLYGLGGLMVVQAIWASRLTIFSTFEGNCPCGSALAGFVTTELSASGFDRLAGPWFLTEAVVTLAILISIWRRARTRPSFA